MLTTPQNLAAVFTSFDAIFQDAFIAAKVEVPPFIYDVDSTTAAMSHNFLGSAPRMREFIGQRQAVGATSNNFIIRNRKWEASFEVEQETFEDDQLGLIKPLIQGLAYEAQRHPVELAIQLLPAGFTTKAWDGVNFFGDHTKVVPGQANKAWINNNLGALSLGSTQYGQARAALRLANDDRGRPLNFDLSGNNTYLFHGPNMEEVVTQLLNSDFTIGPMPAKGGGGAGTMASNVWKGTATPYTTAYITDWSWGLVYTGRPGSKPLLRQWRIKPALVQKTNPETSEKVYQEDKYEYGIRGRYAVGYAFFAAAIASTGNANNA